MLALVFFILIPTIATLITWLVIRLMGEAQTIAKIIVGLITYVASCIVTTVFLFLAYMFVMGDRGFSPMPIDTSESQQFVADSLIISTEVNEIEKDLSIKLSDSINCTHFNFMGNNRAIEVHLLATDVDCNLPYIAPGDARIALTNIMRDLCERDSRVERIVRCVNESGLNFTIYMYDHNDNMKYACDLNPSHLLSTDNAEEEDSDE